MEIVRNFLNFFGISSQTKKEKEKVNIEGREKLSQSIEAFRNRPIHKELTAKIIDTTSDASLLQVIFDNLSEKLPTDSKKEYETVMSWNKSRQAIYMIWLLEGEVNNGGYNQFYFNSSGQFYKHLPELLRLVEANKYAELMQRANGIFEKDNEKITEHQDGTSEGFSKSYEDNPLNDLDMEFYELYKIENLQQIQIDYIRKNNIEFID